MIMKLSKLAALGVLSITAGVSQSIGLQGKKTLKQKASRFPSKRLRPKWSSTLAKKSLKARSRAVFKSLEATSCHAMEEVLLIISWCLERGNGVPARLWITVFVVLSLCKWHSGVRNNAVLDVVDRARLPRNVRLGSTLRTLWLLHIQAIFLQCHTYIGPPTWARRANGIPIWVPQPQLQLLLQLRHLFLPVRQQHPHLLCCQHLLLNQHIQLTVCYLWFGASRLYLHLKCSYGSVLPKKLLTNWCEALLPKTNCFAVLESTIIAK